MRIKKLEIKGFKSFVDKTVLEFKPGVAAIVGPNGCGKSNIFEAIRWVMGEQRVRSLRSRKMEDVIFGGSDSRKQIGMAEVKLVLDNVEGAVSGPLADYDEIMVARRLFRDGESQYEINKLPCRLSDVADFFLDTGVGKNSYAIIEQGQVDMIVASRPEDRRVLIEEAAGINRYKARREAAAKKLEQTRQNLVRISDVINEVKRQFTSLKKQAAKAERFRQVSERLREMDIAFHAHKVAILEAELSSVTVELERQRSQMTAQETRYASAHGELEKDRFAALQTDSALKETMDARHRIDLDLAAARSLLDRNAAEIAQIAAFNERFQLEKEALESEIEEAALRLDALTKERSACADAADAAANELEVAARAMKDAERELAKEKALSEKLREEVFRFMQEAAQLKNRREALLRRGQETKAEIGRIGRDLERTGGALENELAQAKELELKAEQTSDRRVQETAARDSLIRQQQDLRRQVRTAGDRLSSQERELASKTARRQSLEEMQRNFSAYDDGVRSLMQDPEFSGREGLLGPLAEMMEVAPEFQKALTAALGERVGYVVVSTPREGALAAHRLQQTGAGRTTFIPQSPRSCSESQPAEIPDGLIRLADLVRLRDGMDGLGDFILSRFYVVDDISSAVSVWETNGVDIDLVTSNGDVLTRHGEITGGSAEGLRVDIFERKREIADLTDRISVLETETIALRSDLALDEKRLEQLSIDIDQTVRSLGELNVLAAQIAKDREQRVKQAQNLQRKQDVLGLDKERLSKDLQRLERETSQNDEALSRVESDLKQMQAKKEEAGQQADALARSAREASERTAELRVKTAQLQERRLALEKEHRSAADAAQQTDRLLKNLVEEGERKQAQSTRLTEEVHAANLRERELMQRHSALSLELESGQAASASLAESIKALETEASDAGKALQGLRNAIHSLEMDSIRIGQDLKGLVQKIIEKYHVDVRGVAAGATPPDEQEISDLRDKLDSIGDVNLAAIAECKQSEERLAFLTSQEDDLKRAVESLYATIDKINATTRERFADAFRSINEKFQEIFPYLFRGGEARLELTNEEDLLETGVEIMARPPGKRIKNMDLLSGGEKALTAVALIFSIFLTKPSPFCLLDEVDAPLDESNIDRFNELLRQLSDRTQFLVVTHNKRSMEAADMLYGVTMEEPGASTVVSVEFAR